MMKSEKSDSTLLLTFDRPEKRNSLHAGLIQAFSNALAEAENDPSINVVVVTGAGGSFCAGLDLNHLSSINAKEKILYVQSFFALFRQLYTLRPPVIASINGPAVAAGFDLAVACDIRLCSPVATFAQTEILLGITQMQYPVYEIIGLGRAKELALTGKAISADEAYRIGLVNHIYPAQELLPETMTFARMLAAKPRQALFATKRQSREILQLNTQAALTYMFDAICERLQTEEHRREIEIYVTERKGKNP